MIRRDAARATPDGAGRPFRRRDYWSPAARWLSMIPLWLIIFPITRVLELLGRWPDAIVRGMTRMTTDFEGYTPGPQDVMVCSYFKSGTNWTMQIVTQIAHRGNVEFDHIHDIVPWIELPARNRYSVPVSDHSTWRSAPTGLRAVKTHLPFGKLAFVPEARYVWVVRDPKDVFVSSYRFIGASILGPLMPSVRQWFELFLTESSLIGSWAEHADDGWRHRDADNVLFLTYEEMRQDLRRTVARIAQFMDVHLMPDEFEAVVEKSGYAWMKANSRQFDTRGLSPPWATPRGAMVRRGQTGSAEELLSPADQARVDDFWQGELEKRGSDFPYDRTYRVARS